MSTTTYSAVMVVNFKHNLLRILSFTYCIEFSDVWKCKKIKHPTSFLFFFQFFLWVFLIVWGCWLRKEIIVIFWDVEFKKKKKHFQSGWKIWVSGVRVILSYYTANLVLSKICVSNWKYSSLQNAFHHI